MAKVSSVIPNLFNGVSQQASSLRLISQGDEQFNMYPSLVQGLVKRPPVEFVSELPATVSESQGTLHVVDRGGDSVDGRERCFLFIRDSDICAFKPDGTLKPCIFEGNSREYLSGSSGKFELMTLADTTFIVNPSKKVMMNTTKRTPKYNDTAIIYIKQAAYDTLYTIEVSAVGPIGNPTQFVHTSNAVLLTPSSVGDTSNPPERISTSTIASNMANQLNKPHIRALSINDDSNIYVSVEDNYKIEYIKVHASTSDNLIKAVHKNVERFSDLPSIGMAGMIVKVTGTDTSRFNDYYVQYVSTTGYNWAVSPGVSMYISSAGYWKECAAPDILYSMDASTLPHVLVDNGSTFTFKSYNKWGERTVGDEDTAPNPEFIGSPITGLFQYRNRLGLLSEDVVALSEASEFFNFFPTTALTVKDSDPISMTASIDGAPTLRNAIPFNEEVILFSDRSQFKITSPEILSPATAAINTTTYYPTSSSVKPVANGRNIFFIHTPENTAFSRVFEYYIDSDTGTKAAMDITAHVPQYVSAKANHLTCSKGLDLLCLFSTEPNSRELFMYKYYWAGNDKLQSAWFKLAIGDDNEIKGAMFLDDFLYLVLVNKTTQRSFLCKIDFSSTLSGAESISVEKNDLLTNAKFKPHLDILIQGQSLHEASYDEVKNETSFSSVLYPYTGNAIFIDSTRKRELPFLRKEGSVFIFRGDIRSSVVDIGEPYPAYYVFSTPYIRGQGGESSGMISTHSGRIQLQRWSLILGPTGFLEAVVRSQDGQRFVYPWTGVVSGMAGYALGRANVHEDSKFTFPVRGNAKEIEVQINNNTWQPSTIISSEWEANYITRGLSKI